MRHSVPVGRGDRIQIFPCDRRRKRIVRDRLLFVVGKPDDAAARLYAARTAAYHIRRQNDLFTDIVCVIHFSERNGERRDIIRRDDLVCLHFFVSRAIDCAVPQFVLSGSGGGKRIFRRLVFAAARTHLHAHFHFSVFHVDRGSRGKRIRAADLCQRQFFRVDGQGRSRNVCKHFARHRLSAHRQYEILYLRAGKVIRTYADVHDAAFKAAPFVAVTHRIRIRQAKNGLPCPVMIHRANGLCFVVIAELHRQICIARISVCIARKRNVARFKESVYIVGGSVLIPLLRRIAVRGYGDQRSVRPPAVFRKRDLHPYIGIVRIRHANGKIAEIDRAAIGYKRHERNNFPRSSRNIDRIVQNSGRTRHRTRNEYAACRIRSIIRRLPSGTDRER